MWHNDCVGDHFTTMDSRALQATWITYCGRIAMLEYLQCSLLHFAMLANAAYFVHSPSVLQSIIHVVLNKAYVSCMTTVLGAASSGDSVVQLYRANVTPPEKLMLQLQAAALA
ncbi:uncharacterized protein LAESUDRAFT_550557 [Laetiporus sulphureus 93-53]|uniref:Uncharacterized protein n=1 Tax=Laetiporus sulphureus 93-53 TaxID=1314785 RepID=A0A165FSU3_9APHY|nr:uncharacterized protein LAESUDRAFT_550557 [Laetiporus sulphureus 93-53]KZT09368.1 hypothetical protein LAESUDRAFT_550557 [Laetiporus sulphureus 93-53]